MEPLKKLVTLLVATCIIWLSVLVVGRVDDAEFVRGVALILALISTMTIWSMWALNEYGINVDGTPREKAKRDVDSGEDPRLALLLSLFTPDERDALRSRLVDELQADGEAVSLVDLLAQQEQDDTHAGSSS
ncbi:MAG TPA: hypothetical protein VMT24_01915 [Aggregatilineaceae bacterium]|jgi:hypothetical protein|nr:hypothetical protein [Aggregatilineaceae bacterium]